MSNPFQSSGLNFKDFCGCCTITQTTWSNTTPNQTSGSLQVLVLVFLPPARRYQKKDHSRPQWDWLEVAPFCHKPNLSPSIHLVSLFSSLHQSQSPQGRESEELKVESGASKSSWNGSPLCGGERGNAKETPPLLEPLCRERKHSIWVMMPDDHLRQLVKYSREKDLRAEICLYVC